VSWLPGLKGGSTQFYVSFTDVSHPSGPSILQWVKSAPKWRVAQHGLNLEGQCQNSQCQAYGQNVIMPQGMRVFDLVYQTDSSTTKCPCCAKFVMPTMVAFNNCLYKWTGVKGEQRLRRSRGAQASRRREFDRLICLQHVQ
jgi:hypothetical protein